MLAYCQYALALLQARIAKLTGVAFWSAPIPAARRTGARPMVAVIRHRTEPKPKGIGEVTTLQLIIVETKWNAKQTGEATTFAIESYVSPNNHIQPTRNSARLFAHGFAIVAQTPHYVAVG